jgi:phosphoribosylaminoimidazole-succinocarboxamide synthase
VVVSRRTCKRISHRLGLGDFLILGKGMTTQMRIPQSVLADVFESLVAAIYLDGGSEAAAERGVILADTKFEFGLVNGDIILIDEVLTPDSSRYWPADVWMPGTTMPSYDKQPVRDWLEAQDWNKKPPAPVLPREVVATTHDQYTEAYELVTGEPFDAYLTRWGAR